MRISDWSSDVCSSDLRRVEAYGGGAIIVAAERDVLDADEVADMLHRLRNARGRGVADRGVPIADADQPARCRDVLALFVRPVAVDLARRLHAAVSGDAGAARDFAAVARMGAVSGQSVSVS